MSSPESSWTPWRKSSYSGATGTGDCVEVAWRKSSFSGTGTGNCVEVAVTVDAVAIRDSKNPDGPHLEFPHPHWHQFLN
jgi:hypothetical protein